jgi:ATP adenylyltransferase
VINLSELSDPELYAFDEFVELAKSRLERHYGPVCSFEHGPNRPGGPVGCSIDHAHLHVIPLSSSLVALAEKDYPELSWRRVSSLSTALTGRHEAPYLVVEDHDGTASIATGPDIPSQALRRTIAAATGRREEWDWKKHPQTSAVARTLQRLAGL